VATTHHPTTFEDLDRMILEDLARPRLRGERGPSSVARRLGHDRQTVADAMRLLEADCKLERYMGLRPSPDGHAYLAQLHRRP
jgi:hypothetical protein